MKHLSGTSIQTGREKNDSLMKKKNVKESRATSRKKIPARHTSWCVYSRSHKLVVAEKSAAARTRGVVFHPTRNQMPLRVVETALLKTLWFSS
jgi:hypothetical protein